MLTQSATRNPAAAYRNARTQRLTRAAMRQLSDHMLQDIGLTRYDIETYIR